MVFDRKKYMQDYNKRPENRAAQKAARKRWHAKPGVLKHLSEKKRVENATEKGKQAQRARCLRRNYGLTLQDYDQRLKDQDGCCAICRIEVWTEPTGKLHVDHNHDTGEVRGLLCGKCNTGLGLYRDTPALLIAAAVYLENSGG